MIYALIWLITEHDLQQLRRRCDPGPEVWCPFRSRSSTVSTLPLNVFIFSDASSLASQLHSQNNHLVNFLSVGILNRFISIWIICFILCILRHSKALFREGFKYFFFIKDRRKLIYQSLHGIASLQYFQVFHQPSLAEI